MSQKIIYLDYAAATPLAKPVLQAMRPYFSEQFYNPSASYRPAIMVRRAVANARQTVASVLGVKADEVIFTAGATESINLAFHGTLTDGGHVVVSSIEHAGVIETAKQYNHTIVDVQASGRIAVDKFTESIGEDTRLVSVSLVNNEIGTVQPIKEIAARLEQIRRGRRRIGNHTPLWFHSDASQAAGVMGLNCRRLGIDMLTLSGAKIYGPKQTGILWANNLAALRPLIYGGGQEKNLRSGTENVAAIVGFSAALETAQSQRRDESQRLQTLQDWFVGCLMQNFDDMVVIGDWRRFGAPHIITLGWPNLDAERALFRLEEEGILVATGAACAANKATRSWALTSLGLSNAIIDGSLRFSFGRGNSLAQLKRAAKIVSMVIKQERRQL